MLGVGLGNSLLVASIWSVQRLVHLWCVNVRDVALILQLGMLVLVYALFDYSRRFVWQLQWILLVSALTILNCIIVAFIAPSWIIVNSVWCLFLAHLYSLLFFLQIRWWLIINCTWIVIRISFWWLAIYKCWLDDSVTVCFVDSLTIRRCQECSGVLVWGLLLLVGMLLCYRLMIRLLLWGLRELLLGGILVGLGLVDGK